MARLTWLKTGVAFSLLMASGLWLGEGRSSHHASGSNGVGAPLVAAGQAAVAHDSQVAPAVHYRPLTDRWPAQQPARRLPATDPPVMRRMPPVSLSLQERPAAAVPRPGDPAVAEARPVDLSGQMWPPMEHAGGSFETPRAVAVPVSLAPEHRPPPGPQPVSHPQPIAATATRPPLARPLAQPPVEASAPVPQVGSPAAWEWRHAGSSLFPVAQRADGLIDRAFRLADKGALYSARSDFRAALRAVCSALDARAGHSAHTQTLEDGFRALVEADGFASGGQSAIARTDVAAIVAAHRTPILKSYDLSNTPAVTAMQHYYAYAQDRLVKACGGAPPASRALHGLGKVYGALAVGPPSGERSAGLKAMACHQAALLVDRNNYIAANELGVLLARFGQLPAARGALQYCVSIHPVAEVWHNLAVVHERLGETDLAGKAQYQWQLAQQAAGPHSAGSGQPTVQWVDPQTFSQSGPGGIVAAAPGPAPQSARGPSRFRLW